MDDFVTIITTENVLRSDFLLFVIEEPQKFDEATKHHCWIQSMKLELNSIQKQNLKLVNLLEGKNPINAKWIFKVKPNLDGKLEKLKTQLDAYAYEQHEGIDFEKMFAHVVKWNTIRSIVALVVHGKWEIFHLDVKIAFLNGDTTKRICDSKSRN
jgi:hypothetical protein